MLPPFRPPVPRPELIDSFKTVDLRSGTAEQITQHLFDLVHGANYNAPQRFVPRNYHQLRRAS